MNLLSALLSEGSIIDLDGTFFLQLVIFWIAYFILKATVFKPILAVLDAREETIEGSKREAKEVEHEAKAKQKEFEDQLATVRTRGNEEREKLRAEAKHLESTLLDKVRQETQTELREAEETLATEGRKARKDIETQTPVLAREIASKLLAREVA
ncbi:MAG: ATP synthase F0 subunit B [Sandaracinus sp.]|nr:ATP synthase F0 subunit B [Sandaracinus sp.]